MGLRAGQLTQTDRIVSALACGPATTAQLAASIGCDRGRIVDLVRNLREGGDIEANGVDENGRQIWRLTHPNARRA